MFSDILTPVVVTAASDKHFASFPSHHPVCKLLYVIQMWTLGGPGYDTRDCKSLVPRPSPGGLNQLIDHCNLYLHIVSKYWRSGNNNAEPF